MSVDCAGVAGIEAVVLHQRICEPDEGRLNAPNDKQEGVRSNKKSKNAAFDNQL
ncbi:MAG: hypothetical protein ACK4EX_09905 [Thermaurantimonas sp.]|uniref:hypothetical protein n=1 Tax=Thermaurantimonas sp. TaxID=2681568 RepID=UPI00391D1884